MTDGASSDGNRVPGQFGNPDQTGSRMDDFTQFQLKEYENISQAHFKTNEVLATFYRYFLLITAIPITTIGLALINITQGGMNAEGRVLAYLIFGTSALLLSVVGAAVIAYIEGLRLDAILYARVVNSIRKYFFEKPGANAFGVSVLPTETNKPTYNGFGSSYIIYHACAIMNAVYFSAGVLSLSVDRSVPLVALQISDCQYVIVFVSFLGSMGVQILMRYLLISDKIRKGL